mgnify:CR=1 FL=1
MNPIGRKFPNKLLLIPLIEADNSIKIKLVKLRIGREVALMDNQNCLCISFYLGPNLQ